MGGNMKILLKVVAVLFALFAVAAIVAGLVKVGGLFLVVLVPVTAYVAYILWERVI
jgi:hypothetical protein